MIGFFHCVKYLIIDNSNTPDQLTQIKANGTQMPGFQKKHQLLTGVESLKKNKLPAYPIGSSSGFEIGIEIAIDSEPDPDFDPEKNGNLSEVDNQNKLLSVFCLCLIC